MKGSLIVGVMVGMVTATTLYLSTTNHSWKKAKRSLMNKIEDVIM